MDCYTLPLNEDVRVIVVTFSKSVKIECIIGGDLRRL